MIGVTRTARIGFIRPLMSSATDRSRRASGAEIRFAPSVSSSRASTIRRLGQGSAQNVAESGAPQRRRGDPSNAALRFSAICFAVKGQGTNPNAATAAVTTTTTPAHAAARRILIRLRPRCRSWPCASRGAYTAERNITGNRASAQLRQKPALARARCGTWLTPHHPGKQLRQLPDVLDDEIGVGLERPPLRGSRQDRDADCAGGPRAVEIVHRIADHDDMRRLRLEKARKRQHHPRIRLPAMPGIITCYEFDMAAEAERLDLAPRALLRVVCRDAEPQAHRAQRG